MIIILALGVFLRFWKFDFTKKKFSKNEVQQIVKQEVADAKSKKQ